MNGVLKVHRPSKAVWATHCPGCNRPVRPHNAPEHLWPDTVMAENTSGICGTCAQRKRTADRLAGKDALLRAVPTSFGVKLPAEVRHRLSLENTIAGLESMLRRRRARGVPAEGLLPDEDDS